MTILNDYKGFMEKKPTIIDTMTNTIGQKIEFMEHPDWGDLSTVLVHFPEHNVLADSDFFETDDMMAEHGEYTPAYVDGKVDCQVFLELQPTDEVEDHKVDRDTWNDVVDYFARGLHESGQFPTLECAKENVESVIRVSLKTFPKS